MLIFSVYDDDTTQIPRSTTVVARRLPASRPGAGKAARYVTGKMPVTAKNQHRVEAANVTAQMTSKPVTNNGFAMQAMSEEEKLQSMLNMQDEAWKEDQALKAGKPIIRSTHKPSAVPDKPLPPGYTCHRCGEKGHWIQACPTNGDANFDGRPKFKRTTGIPRSMLKKVEKPIEVGPDGKVDVSKLPPGVMYTPTGEWVVAAPDTATWEKFQAQQNANTEKVKEATADVEELRRRDLLCPIDERPFDRPTKTPCCSKTYCQNCIETALLDNDFVCPNCEEQALLDDLMDDKESEDKLKQYQEEKAAEKAAKDKAGSQSPDSAASPTPDSANDEKSPAPDTKSNGEDSAASTPKPRKRTAEEELENQRQPANPAEQRLANGSKPSTPIPTGPKADQRRNQSNMMSMGGDMQEFVQQMQSMSSMQPGMMAPFGPMMPGFMPGMMPNMPFPPMPNPFGMPGMIGMDNMAAMGSFGGSMQNVGWPAQQSSWGSNGGEMQNSGGSGGAYFRAPVNQHRHQQGRQTRLHPRAVDYKQLGS